MSSITKFDFKDLLEKSFTLIDKYHKGQKDKAGKDYKLHLLAVKDIALFRNKEKSTSFQNKLVIVALLHDLLEDTKCDLSELIELEFIEELLNSIQLLTKQGNLSKKEKKEYFRKIKEDEIAKEIKIADILHNMDLLRLSVITEKDIARNQEYLRQLNYLLFNE